MKPSYRIQTYQSLDAAPLKYRFMAVIWISSGKTKRWERLPLITNGETAAIARNAAASYWDDQMDKVAKNRARRETGRSGGQPLTYRHAPEFFSALEDLTEVLKENTEVRLDLLTEDGLDQRGMGIRE